MQYFVKPGQFLVPSFVSLHRRRYVCVHQVYIFTDGLSIVKRKNNIALQEKKLVYVYHVKYVIFISEDRFLACACVLLPSIRKLTFIIFLIYLRSLLFASILIFAFH